MHAIRALVVANNPVFLQAVMQSLCRHEYIAEALAVQSTQEAVNLQKQETIEVIFLDSGLQDMSVADAVRVLKAWQPNSRVVLMTTVDPALYRTAMPRLGVDGIIDKHHFTTEVWAYFASMRKESNDVEIIPRWL